MIKAAEQVAYPLTGYFSSLVSDYLEANQKLAPFYTHPPNKLFYDLLARNQKLFAVHNIKFSDFLSCKMYYLISPFSKYSNN